MLLLAAPIVVGGTIVLATVSWFAAVQGTSGRAGGELARLSFASECAEQARPVILARLEEYGLQPEPEPGLSVRVRTPGMADDLEHLPRALTAPGRFEVRVNGVKFLDRFDDVGVQLALSSGAPITLFALPESLPVEGVEVLLDGQPVTTETAGGVELQVPATGATPREALRLATDRVVALRHPLPCAVTPTGAEWVK